MVNALKRNFSPHLAGKFRKSTKQSPHQHHQVNEGKSGLEEERARALRALPSLLLEAKLSAGKRWGTHFSSQEEKQK